MEQQEEYKPERSTVPMLARLYKVSQRTIRRELAKLRPEIGEKKGHFLPIEKVETFVKHYGRPFLVFFGIVKSSDTAATDTVNHAHPGDSIVPPSGDHGIGFFHPAMLVITGLMTVISLKNMTRHSAYAFGVHKSTDLYRTRLILSIISILISSFLGSYFLGKMIF